MPGALLGWDRNHQLLESWTEQMVTPYLVKGEVTTERHNQSLPGLMYRMLTASPSHSIYVEDQDRYDRRHYSPGDGAEQYYDRR